MIRIRTKFSILVACSLVIAALFYTEHALVQPINNFFIKLGFSDSVQKIKGITDIRSTDHLRGKSVSDVLLIEYSDYTCVFCAVMRKTFERLVREEDVQIAYRHFYDTRNKEGIKRAIFAECVARIAGEKEFRAYSNFLYTNQSLSLDETVLTKEALAFGINALSFKQCRDNKSIQSYIMRDSNEASTLGARGTPFIVVVQDGKPITSLYASEYTVFVKQLRKVLRKELLKS